MRRDEWSPMSVELLMRLINDLEKLGASVVDLRIASFHG